MDSATFGDMDESFFAGRGRGESGSTNHGADVRGWAGRSDGVAAMEVRPAHQVIAQSAQATITVLELRRYADGCSIEVEAVATTGDAAPGEVLRSAMAQPASGTEIPDAVLWFGVQLSDGRTATTLDHPVIPLSPPTQPYLASIGGPGYQISGKQLRTRQILWLWPAPASDKFELMVEWPVFSIPVTRVAVDGETLTIESGGQ
jgi:hypothetical protein